MAAGCAGDLSALDPAGPSARAISLLWWIMLGAGAAIFVAVGAVLTAACMKPRWLDRLSPLQLVTWGGLVLPSVILTALVVSAFVLGERLIGPHGSESPLRIEAEGRQWHWRFRYPEAGGVLTLDRLHIPAGREVEFVVTSGDVIHSFWIPRLGGKIDAVPGHRNTIRLMAERPGVYGGVCAEFCGEGHGPMTFTVEAHPPETYAQVLAGAALRGER